MLLFDAAHLGKHNIGGMQVCSGIRRQYATHHDQMLEHARPSLIEAEIKEGIAYQI